MYLTQFTIFPRSAAFAFLSLGFCILGLQEVRSQEVAYWRFEDAANLGKDSGSENLKAKAAIQSLPSSVENGLAPIVFPNPIPSTHQPNKRVASFKRDQKEGFRISGNKLAGLNNFTVEAFIRLESYSPGTDYSVIVASGGNDKKGEMGWQLLVTGEGSPRGPGQLIFQMDEDGVLPAGLETLASGIHIETGVNYYLCLQVNSAAKTVTFLKRELKSGAELEKVEKTYKGSEIHHSKAGITIGCGEGSSGFWNGILDEIRISEGVLPDNQRLIR